MRDPERIPLILKAIERLWRADPGMRFGQLLTNTLGDAGVTNLWSIEDEELLQVIGAETEEELAYIDGEYRKAAWAAFGALYRDPRNHEVEGLE